MPGYQSHVTPDFKPVDLVGAAQAGTADAIAIGNYGLHAQQVASQIQETAMRIQGEQMDLQKKQAMVPFEVEEARLKIENLKHDNMVKNLVETPERLIARMNIDDQMKQVQMQKEQAQMGEIAAKQAKENAQSQLSKDYSDVYLKYVDAGRRAAAIKASGAEDIMKGISDQELVTLGSHTGEDIANQKTNLESIQHGFKKAAEFVTGIPAEQQSMTDLVQGGNALLRVLVAPIWGMKMIGQKIFQSLNAPPELKSIGEEIQSRVKEVQSSGIPVEQKNQIAARLNSPSFVNKMKDRATQLHTAYDKDSVIKQIHEYLDEQITGIKSGKGKEFQTRKAKVEADYRRALDEQEQYRQAAELLKGKFPNTQGTVTSTVDSMGGTKTVTKQPLQPNSHYMVGGVMKTTDADGQFIQ